MHKFTNEVEMRRVSGLGKDVRPEEIVWCLLASSVAALAVCFDIVNPIAVISVVIVAIASKAVLDQSQGTVSEHMTTGDATQGDTVSNVSSGGALSAQSFDMPSLDNLIHFTYPSVAAKDEPEQIIDLVSKQGFKYEPPPDATSPKWIGPPANVIMSNAVGTEPGLSVFVTLENGLQVDALEESGTVSIDSPRTSLFMAYASDNNTDGSVKEKHIQLAVYKLADAQSLGGHRLVLHGRFGDDEVQIAYVPTQYARTHFLIRDGSRLTIGWYDPYMKNAVATEESVLAKSPSMSYDSKPCIVNATKSPIGRIRSVVIYKQGMRDHLQAILRGIASHTFLQNELYKRLFDDLSSLRKSVRDQKSNAPVANVQQACSTVSDWTRFDPINATEECRAAIDESCKKDPSQPFCGCWTEEFMHKPECIALRAVYSGQKLVPAEAVKPAATAQPASATPTPQKEAVVGPVYEPSTYTKYPPWWQRLLPN